MITTIIVITITITIIITAARKNFCSTSMRGGALSSIELRD